jgi:hypothetical protein
MGGDAVKAKRATIELEVVGRMKYYLGCHPEAVFATALDLTKMVATASKAKTLDLWLAQMTDLTPGYAPDKPAAPKSSPRRKTPTQKRR